MKVKTHYFGEVEYEEDELITLPQGLYGFEEYKKFLPLPFEEDNDALLYFQSVEEEEISFLLINPFSFFPGYEPQLNAEDLEKWKADNTSELSFYAILVSGETMKESTANLRSPLVIHAPSRTGYQVILDNVSYSLKQPLCESLLKEEKEKC